VEINKALDILTAGIGGDHATAIRGVVGCYYQTALGDGLSPSDAVKMAVDKYAEYKLQPGVDCPKKGESENGKIKSKS